MRLPEGTVKARLARARVLLRTRFPDLENEQASIEASNLKIGKEA
jgi:DNA-directed RNA polymerase specialized sigma24 family protein